MMAIAAHLRAVRKNQSWAPTSWALLLQAAADAILYLSRQRNAIAHQADQDHVAVGFQALSQALASL
jgi:hypothetical protein